MTISTTTNVVIHTGNGIAVTFPYAFPIPDVDTLFVYLLDATTNEILQLLAPGTYTALGIGDPLGGSVTYPLVGAPLDATRKLMIQRTMPYTQDLDIQNEGGFYPDVVEKQLDFIVMQIQQIAEIQDRSIVSPPGIPGQTFPPPEDGKVIGWDNSELVNIDPSEFIADGLFPDPPDARYVLKVPVYVETRAALKALNTTKDVVAFLKEDKREGIFEWQPGDFSVEVGIDTFEGVYLKADGIPSSNGAWVRKDMPKVQTDWFGAVPDGLTVTNAQIQGAVDIATRLGLRAYINNGTYNAPGVDTPSNCIIEWAPNAWIRPLTYSPPGAVICNKIFPAIERPFARENITLINPQVDGTALAFSGPGPQQNDNAVGFATGVKKVRVYGGHLVGFRANFDDGPGGKGFGVEQGVNDVIVWGTKITNCTYATFVSSHIFDDTKLAWDISFHDLHIEQCAAVCFLLGHDPNPGAVPTTNPRKCSAAYYGVTAYDCGHAPDRNTADYRQKCGPIVIQGFSNLIMRGLKINNSPGYPNATYPAGGTLYPTGWPALGETRVGAGMTGTGVGAVIWGWGRNWNLDIDFNGETDDIWNIQRPQAHSSVNMGTSVAPNSVFGMAIKVVYRGSTKGLINSGAIGTTGTLTAGTATTATFPVNSNLPTRDEGLAGVPLAITGGTGSGQSKRISTYNASTRVATIEGTFSPAPDATSTFSLGSTRAIADAEINGFIEIVSDNPSISLVSNLARFPTAIKLIARNSSDLMISASFNDVFNFNNTYATGATTKGDTYTPTLTNTLNITSSTPFLTKYQRIDKVVTVTGLVTFTPTAASAITLDISLPIPSDLTSSSQVIGLCSNNGGNSGTVVSNTVNDRAQLSYTPTSTALQTVAFSFSYNIT